MLDGAAPVSLAVPVVAAAPVLPADRPAVIVTGKYVISLGARVVVLSPGEFAAEPAYDSMHTPAVVPVKVQSTDMVKSCTSWNEKVSHWIHSRTNSTNLAQVQAARSFSNIDPSIISTVARINALRTRNHISCHRARRTNDAGHKLLRIGVRQEERDDGTAR